MFWAFGFGTGFGRDIGIFGEHWGTWTWSWISVGGMAWLLMAFGQFGRIYPGLMSM